MRPLIFLTVRTFVNGVRRAVSSPRRLIGLIFFVLYYVWIFRPFNPVGRNTFNPARAKWDFPALPVIEAVIFAGFCFLTLILAMGVFSYRGGFKPADVDVLFPTPVSPRLVVIFRLVRDYLLTLFAPLFFAIFLYRPASAGWTVLFRKLPHPETSGQVLRTATIAWILTSVAWVSLGYGISLYFNRPEERIERLRTRLGWALGILFASAILYIALGFRMAEEVSDLAALSQSPFLRTTFVLATAATWLTMAPLQGSWLGIILGAGTLLGAATAGIALAFRQTEWLYEEAAARTDQSLQTRQLQRKGDYYGIVAEQARSGKFKVRRRSWMYRWKAKGHLALLWKEYFLQGRGGRGLYLIFPLVGVAGSLLPVLSLKDTMGPAVGPFLLFMQLLIAFMCTASVSQTGYLEILKRVDLQKPLPFSPGTIIFMEVFAKSILGTICCAAGSLAVLAFAPGLWQICLTSLLGLPSMTLLLSSIFFVVIILFPDIDDATQRGFRGLVQMLAVVLFCGPSVGIFAILTLILHWPFLTAVIPFIGINIGLSIFASVVAGGLYASFNPSE